MKPINKIIPFKKMKMHIIPGSEQGSVEWIRLEDICRALLRKEMFTSGKVLGLCNSQRKFPIYGNGKLEWFIQIPDIYAITRSVRKDNKTVAKLCDDLDKWAGDLPIGNIHYEKPKDKKKSQEEKTASQDANLVKFQYQDQTISFKAENGKTYFNATEMARSFGKNPREWLLLAETQRLRKTLVNQGKSESWESQIITSRGSFGNTWIEENLGMEFSRWLSPEFSQWCNDRMQDLFTKGFVTLRKEDESFFMTPYGEQKKLPANFKEALLQLAAAEDYIEVQHKKIEEDRPKVEFYNDFIENRDSFKTSLIAEELRISTVQLYRFLVEERIVRWEKRHYVAYPNHAALQCDHPYLWTNPKTGKTYPHAKTKRWTKAGREYILELYRRKNN
jgi:phage antirepressor YoqD-like protein